LQAARDEIWQSWRYTCAENADHPRARELFDRHKLPAFHDPFVGGGSITVNGIEIRYSSNKPDDLALALVEFLNCDSPQVHPIRQSPGGRTEFGVASVNHEFAELLVLVWGPL
jgi:hypothetical protein